MNPLISLGVVCLISGTIVVCANANRFEQLVEQSTNEYDAANGGAYQFSYSTGSSGLNEAAQHFREESRDEYGNVIGKYGYIDPYGQLRVVNYRAGPDGYVASGDIGPDQEVLRQQKQLYANDPATVIQAQAWQKLGANVYGIDTTQQQTTSQQTHQSEWTSVSGADQATNQATSGQHRYVERLVAAPVLSVKSSPAAALRTQRTHWQKQNFGQVETRQSAPYRSQQYSNVYQVRQVQPVVTTAKYIQPTKGYAVTSAQLKSPAARLTSKSYSKASSGAYTSAGTKSTTYGALKAAPIKVAPVKVARYADAAGSRGYSVVNFKQFGPQPFSYSYSF